jgi:hypothetical protein
MHATANCAYCSLYCGYNRLYYIIQQDNIENYNTVVNKTKIETVLASTFGQKP